MIVKNKNLNQLKDIIEFCRDNKFKNIIDSDIILEQSIPFYKKGNIIKIKKENKGKFTKYCGGNVTSKCIARGKKSSSPIIRKRATFADNARKWKHFNGGIINLPQINKTSYYKNIF